MACANASGAFAVTSITTSASAPAAWRSARDRIVVRHVDCEVGAEVGGHVRGAARRADLDR